MTTEWALDTANVEWTEFQALAPERVIAGQPRGRFSAGGQGAAYRFGLWEITEGSFHAIPSADDEIVHILQGSGMIRPESGEPIVLRPGAIFELPAGFRGEWHVSEPVRKAYVLVARPEASPAGEAR